MDEKEIRQRIHDNRNFMKSGFGREEYVSDQKKLLPQPPLTKAAVSEVRIPLAKEFASVITQNNYLELVSRRQSERFYKPEPMTLDQLSFLLWSTQGVKGIRGKNYATLRTVPSAGGRHPFETYLAVLDVEGLSQGIYHYLPIEHQLEFIRPVEQIREETVSALNGQKWGGKAGVVFFYSAVAYRCEWRYSIGSHRVMLMDVGHIVENLYLSCGAIGCGTCAIAALDQEKADALLGLSGEEEYAVYAAPVGVSDPDKNAQETKKLYAFASEDRK